MPKLEQPKPIPLYPFNGPHLGLLCSDISFILAVNEVSDRVRGRQKGTTKVAFCYWHVSVRCALNWALILFSSSVSSCILPLPIDVIEVSQLGNEWVELEHQLNIALKFLTPASIYIIMMLGFL